MVDLSQYILAYVTFVERLIAAHNVLLGPD